MTISLLTETDAQQDVILRLDGIVSTPQCLQFVMRNVETAGELGTSFVMTVTLSIRQIAMINVMGLLEDTHVQEEM